MGNKKKSDEIGIRGFGSISNLEADIMHIAWQKSNVSVREVHEILLKREMEKKERDFIPYTTVMSTMASLADRGYLLKNSDEKTYIYSPAMDSRELSKKLISAAAEKLLS
ncbi:MAG: BlaI/MecI/CopY family transcriptional regulator [Actinobacteria bacterium]|nr:BlaI/MecI/CopY family transcriptional regulator [Actinomycetota bacterium]